jgi:hypothetical protein
MKQVKRTDYSTQLGPLGPPKKSLPFKTLFFFEVRIPSHRAGTPPPVIQPQPSRRNRLQFVLPDQGGGGRLCRVYAWMQCAADDSFESTQLQRQQLGSFLSFDAVMFKPVVVVLSSSDSEEDVVAISSPPRSRLPPSSAAATRQPPKPVPAAPAAAAAAQAPDGMNAQSLGGPTKDPWVWVSGAPAPAHCFACPPPPRPFPCCVSQPLTARLPPRRR